MAICTKRRAVRRAACFFLGALLFSGTLQAAYTIQIGAFRNPSPSYAASASQVASVYVTERSGGVKALSVGSFGSRAEANDALATLQAQYPDAFISTLSESAMLFDGSTIAVDTRPAAEATSNIAVRSGPSTSELSLLDRLSDAERSRVVYLDGVLHVKSGTDFIPLTEYTSN